MRRHFLDRAGRLPAALIAAAALMAAAALAAATPAPAAGPGTAPEAGSGGPEPHVLGFGPTESPAERSREAALARLLSPDSLRRHARILTEEPHVAGTPQDKATADYVLGRFRAYGLDAHLDEVPVYLNYPKRVTLELVEPGPREMLLTREAGMPRDKDAYAREAFDGFNGYAPSGEAEAQVVYANYADVEDFAKLRDLGVDARGKLVLARYGKIFRGLKVRNAEKAGAAGVILYSDPADDGYAKGEVYPDGPYRPEDAIQRGSVQFLSESPGDPTTPGWPSKPGGKRLRGDQAAGIPRIPVTPVSYGQGGKILRALAGPAVPDGWQGALPFTYHLGPGPARARMKVEMDYAVRPIWNVVAMVRGRESPEQWVVCGNHRDAWTYGAIDPNSGSIAMLELARGLGELTRQGWRPRRTIVLCSWDAEEYGLVGSTEWCEGHADHLRRSCVAYLNVDVAVSGRDFRVGGTHALRDALVGALDEVRDPGQNRRVGETWKKRLWNEAKKEFARKNRERRWRGEPPRTFEADVSPLGSGSDYTAFVDHLGIPALDLRFEGPHGTYHSIYDNFEYLDRVVDPGYHFHVALTEIWARLAMRLAEAELLPLRYARTGQFVLDELQSLEEKLDDANVDRPDTAKLAVDWAPLRHAAAQLRERAASFEAQVDAALQGGGAWPGGSAAAANARLIAAERAFLGGGLPGRPWFRHELYAPGLNTGYAPVPLPGLGQAILDKDQAALDRGASALRAALERAAGVMGR
jgi:N-acetylated-alpha-linked acidic dipeptidase